MVIDGWKGTGSCRFMSSSLNPNIYPLGDYDDVKACVGHLNVEVMEVSSTGQAHGTPVFPNGDVRVLIQAARSLRAAGIPLQRGFTPSRWHTEWDDWYEEVIIQLGRPLLKSV